MRVDRATLTDLSILEQGEEGTCLFALLDRTCTGLGRNALRARMRSLPSRSDLRDTQDAIRHLVVRRVALRAAIEFVDADKIDAYLSLNWQALTKHSWLGRFAERLILRFRYREAVRQISRGVGKLTALLEGLPAIIASIRPGPAQLERLARELNELSDLEPMRVIRQARSGVLAEVLEADQVARGAARDSIRRVLAVVAELDALCAIATATAEHGWCFPEFVEPDGVVDFEGLRHAQLAAGTPNDICIDAGQRVLAVTGPNMAGKSTLLKAVGTAVYLAHLGCGVPASRARLSCFDALLASLYVRDSLSGGQSFYLGEVRRIKDLVTALESTPRVFAILDEPFKGTNVHDATEATTLLVDGLCAQDASTVIMTTHLSLVVRSRTDDACLATSFLGAAESEAGPVFDYQPRPGVSDQRLGMVLLEQEGVAPALASAIRRRSEKSVRR